MSLFQRALEEIERGRQGLNTGIPIPFSRLQQYVPNIQKKTYTLIGANAKVGKTSLADDLFLYNVYDYVSREDVEEEAEWHYWSMEIDSISKIIKGVARRLWYKYGIYTDINYVLSKGKNRIAQEVYDKVLECREYFERMEGMLHIYDVPENPTGIFKTLKRVAVDNGTIVTKPITILDNGVERTVNKFSHYIENNPKKYIFPIFDHIALAAQEKGLGDTKSVIDKISQDCVGFRNNYFFSPVVIQQLAFNNDSPERFQQRRLRPQLSDFGDSKYTSRDFRLKTCFLQLCIL